MFVERVSVDRAQRLIWSGQQTYHMKGRRWQHLRSA